jgi:hypothetical protein
VWYNIDACEADRRRWVLPKQRYKIYKIENANFNVNNTTPEGMQAWFDWICRTKWWKDRSKIKHVQVVFPVVGKMSGAVKLGPHLAKVEFGPFSLCQLTGCHELGHVLTWDAEADDEEDHGPRFVGAYLSLVRRYIDANMANALIEEFDEAGVKYTGGI